MSVNGKTAPVMSTVLHLVAQYNAEQTEALRAYNAAKADIDNRLKRAQAEIETRYEQLLLGAIK